MSRTYLGPLGRLLPLNTKLDQQEAKSAPPPPPPPPPSSSRKSAAMLATPAPHLPLPVRLQFGSDPSPGFTDPSRYETMKDSRSTHAGSRLGSSHQKLPSVSQLLTPSSPESNGTSYPLRANVASPVEPRSDQHSSRGGVYADAYNRPDSAYFPRAFAPSTPNQSGYPRAHDQQHSGRNGHYRTPSHGGAEGSSTIYSSSSEQRASQPIGQSPLAASQGTWYQGETMEALKADPRRVTKPVRRLLGEQIIDGVGPCYVYEDGTHVRKVIDGEAVNANWGITKAGKPRKRLAIACKTCREKKIKCEPAEPKCVQCDKSGRECRFETARSNRRH